MMFVPSIENCFLSSFSMTQMAWIQCKNGVHARIGNINTIQNVSIFMAITFALNIKIHCHRLTGNILLSILCVFRVACNIAIQTDGDDDDNNVKSHTHELKTRDCNFNVAANRGIQFILTFFFLSFCNDSVLKACLLLIITLLYYMKKKWEKKTFHCDCVLLWISYCL